MRRKCLRATFAGAVLFLAGCQKQANEPSVQTVTAGVVESIQGTGLIWRLSSITRLEERDGGVYAELEAIALSRDIPAAFRLFVTPIVRRVSRDSLATSLHQTKVAIDDSLAHRKREGLPQ
jgi:hypothetical protein